ncbi:MAG TPA: zinc ABC transporter substrate-binding protein [Gammaproteobacteria bacterium]|jgi:zinc/manganese transport system substrate-binding protein|nr:zinc ABC transporter substrate-binding protein [Gammaproteobacteria bacterium]
MRSLRTLFLILALAASAPAFADLNVFSCEPHWTALVNEIGTSHVNVTTATGAFNDPHFIQARPSLISAMRKADLVVCNGADLEVGWLPVLMQQGARDTVQPGQPGYLEGSQYIQLLQVPSRVDRAQGDIHPYGNPHFQTDPRVITAVAPELAQRMAQLDPANAAEYQKRYADFKTRWDAAVVKWTQEAAPLKGMKLIGYHDGWVYMSNWLGIDMVGFLEPKPGIPPSPSHLADLLATIKSQGVAGIIYTPYEDEQAPEWLSQRGGVPVAQIPDTVGADNDKDLFQFYDLMVNQLLKLHGGGK